MLGIVRGCQRLVSINKLFRNSVTRCKSSYEGEGKTTVNILNKDLDLGIMIDGFNTVGFKLNNSVTIIGPMALFPRTVLSWQVATSKDINVDSLKLFTLLEPKIDLLVIGLEMHTPDLVQPVLEACRTLRLNVEILPTEHAAATFNFLTAEGRNVAAAMLPPLQVEIKDDDILDNQQLNKEIFHSV